MTAQADQPGDVMLIVGGKYHDMDFARLELLKLLAEDDRNRTRVCDDYSRASTLGPATALVTYTCDVAPTPAELLHLRRWLAGGGRWFALHGTNSILEFTADGRVDTPDRAPGLMALLGSRFAAHPPIGRYLVEIADGGHPLTRGIAPFETVDELYLSDTADRLHVLLDTYFAGSAPGFVRSEWAPARHPILYLHRHLAGEVLYLTLGHCRGHYDMRPLVAHWPTIDRCSWELPIYYELLRRGIAWMSDRPGKD